MLEPADDGTLAVGSPESELLPSPDKEEPRKQRIWLVVLGWIGALFAVITLVAVVLGWREYRELAAQVDAQLQQGPFAKTVNFYAAPEMVSVGDEIGIQDLIDSLHRCGYREGYAAGAAWFARGANDIAIHPKDGTGAGTVAFNKNSVVSIQDGNGGSLDSFVPGQPLVANLSAAGRERRILLHFSDLPPVLIHAITSAEDKRFFEHGGYDALRVIKAMYVDAKDRRKEQGASTITMQLARNLYLSPEKKFKRKISEFLITEHLEHALSKRQIFEYYCNQVYLGGYGTFNINGFGEASHAYFNKDVQKLTLPEAAMLAGLIQRPSYFNPFRTPDRARDRRNVVLRLMHANRFINDQQLADSIESPLTLNPGKTEVGETQFSMDLAAAELQRLMENEVAYPGALNVSATIDLRLQKAAEQAVTDGMAQVDKLLAKHRDAKGNMDHAQAALIALDPHTGEILAVVGGRDYGTSQLDRVLSKRPPGSVFKPFVYAAALNSAVDGDGPVLTPASTVDDVPTTFYYDGQTYNPGNFKEEFHGTVTFREALAKSMNVAAVKVGEMIGFDPVVALAREAGMNDDLRPTPALALGAYQVTPLEIARAYTVFANGGMLVQPSPIRSVTAQDGTEIVHNSPETRRVLDERVNFLIVDMMQDVLKYGTAAGVRSRGFTLPAAGKTGTSHDGWFAGFTSNLLCVVWVGFDDYDELGLEGARSALPIWTEFMKSAARYKPYRDAKPFPVPDGITRAAIDPSTGMLATPFCPWNVTDYFVSGTEPKDMCMQHQDEAAPQMAPDPNSINVPAITSLMPSAAPAAPPAR